MKGLAPVDDDSDKYRAPALDKGLDILELLATQETGISRSEIAKSLDRSPSEIFRCWIACSAGATSDAPKRSATH